MAKKPSGSKRAAKANRRKTRQSRHLTPVPARDGSAEGIAANRDDSFERIRSERILESIRPEFLAWYQLEYGDTEEAGECLDGVKLLLNVVGELTGRYPATNFSPGTVRAALEALEPAREQDPDLVDSLLGLWHVYIDFLAETGHWGGTEAEYDVVHELLIEQTGTDLDPVEVQIPEMSQAEQLSGLAELALIQRVGALLRWLGGGRPVTSTGALRLKDIDAAAACVGVKARGSRTRTAGADVQPGGEGAGLDVSGLDGDGVAAAGRDAMGPDGGYVVQSMHEVPILNHIWAALTDAGLITIKSTVVQPGDAAAQWLEGTPEQQTALFGDLIRRFLLLHVFQETSLPVDMGQAASSLEMAVLLSAAKSIPVPTASLESTNTPGDAVDFISDMVRDRVRSRLSRLADLDLVRIEEHYAVAPVVARCVADAFEDITTAFAALAKSAYVDDDEAGDADDTVQATGSENADDDAGQRIYQLNILLRGSKPPIWRRVLIPATCRLDEVHATIQRVFGWMGGHLHLFSSGGGYGDRTFQPMDSLDFDPVEADAEDEAAIRLADVLTHIGDDLTYIYDFGDDWVHGITLEKVISADSGQAYPCCTGGRGADPSEDSGGVWGWAELVGAANNPSDEAYAESREILGLGDGESFDPKAFDHREVDAVLNVYR